MNFAAKPFISITTLFIVGIVLQDVFHVNMLFLVIAGISAVVLGLLVSSVFRWRNVQTALALLSFVLLGALVINERTSKTDWTQIDQLDTNYSCQVQVIECSTKKSEWRKTVCQLHSIVTDENVHPIDAKVLLILNSANVMEGDELMVNTSLRPIVNKGNPGEFNSKQYWRNQGVTRIGFAADHSIQWLGHTDEGMILSYLRAVRNYFSEGLERHLSGSELSIAKALLLGDKSLLTAEDRASFSHAGAMHVLAVSGLHVGIVLYLILFILKRFPRYISSNAAVLIALIIIWCYAAITGFSPSVLRASFMFSMLVLGQWLGRDADSMNILFFSAFILLLINPLLIYSIGFQLSYLAMTGIFLFYQPLVRLVRIRNPWLRRVWEGTVLGVAAQLTTVPLTLYYFHFFPNYFALSNLLVMVVAGIILGLGLLVLVMPELGVVSHALWVVLGFAIGGLLFGMQFVERLPGAVAYGFDYSLDVVVGFYILLVTYAIFQTRHRIRWLLVLIAFPLISYVQYRRYQNYRLNELVVFNANPLTVVVKKGELILCLFPAESDAKVVDFLLNSYRKIYPGVVKELPMELEELQVTMGNWTVMAENRSDLFKLQIGSNAWVVLKSHSASQPPECEVIDMPYLEPHEGHYNLRFGAYRKQL